MSQRPYLSEATARKITEIAEHFGWSDVPISQAIATIIEDVHLMLGLSDRRTIITDAKLVQMMVNLRGIEQRIENPVDRDLNRTEKSLKTVKIHQEQDSYPNNPTTELAEPVAEDLVSVSSLLNALDEYDED
ncbi:hypothetical protein IQ250_04590 [Pseudanabaenaceae cyanobacterium LEGE 13415]|nr:hypothetical protein [Pseudanabaenaceae cyanobacterium LEGE 13415]